MKLIFTATFSFLLFFQVVSQSTEMQNIYVGTFTSEGSEGIYRCSFNSKTGDISLAETFKGIDNPSYLEISPDKKYLYAVTRVPENIEESGGYISAYKITKRGGLQFLNKQKSNGSGPCYVDVSADGKYAAIATYGGGTTSLYPILNNGYLQTASSVIVNKGKSIHPKRQNKPYAHSIQFSPFNNQVLSADLGTDQLNMYRLENGKLVSDSPAFLKLVAGSGPRHFEWSKNGKAIFVINELNSTISVFKKTNGKWENSQNISTLPTNFDGVNYCADIHISKDGRFLYGSNRGHNSIAVFTVDENSQQLSFVKIVLVKGDWPRNFTLSPDGNFLLVANQKSNNITVFRINNTTGIPEFTGKKLSLPAPVCLKFL